MSDIISDAEGCGRDDRAAAVSAELAAYREYVRGVADAEDGTKVILNRSPQHAAIIIERLFLKGREYIDILTQRLDGTVYGSLAVVDAAIQFLRADSNRRINVVAETPIEVQSHPFIAALRTAGAASQIRLFTAPTSLQEKYLCNFIVVDGRHFRYETDRASPEAMIQFGNSGTGQSLKTFFEDLKRVSPETPILQ